MIFYAVLTMSTKDEEYILREDQVKKFFVILVGKRGPNSIMSEDMIGCKSFIATSEDQ